MAEAVLEKTDTVVTPASMTARVLSDARRAFGNRADEHVLERYASQAVAGLWRESIKVTTFVPVLALRQVRDMLEGDDVTP
jgi:hypothetical protein